MLIMPYDIESKSRNADFILIARKGDTTTLGPKGRCPLSEAHITRRRQAATTFGAKPRQPTPLNLLNPLNPHTAGVSII